MTHPIDELRDLMTANYEDVRRAFAQIREGDLGRDAGGGAPLAHLVSEIVAAPRRCAQRAERLADGKSPGLSPFARAMDAITGWRARRAFVKATRADVLTAWENAFNELFSCVNDLAAGQEGEAAAQVSADNFSRACACIRSELERWPAWATKVRATTSVTATP